MGKRLLILSSWSSMMRFTELPMNSSRSQKIKDPLRPEPELMNSWPRVKP